MSHKERRILGLTWCGYVLNFGLEGINFVFIANVRFVIGEAEGDKLCLNSRAWFWTSCRAQRAGVPPTTLTRMKAVKCGSHAGDETCGQTNIGFRLLVAFPRVPRLSV